MDKRVTIRMYRVSRREQFGIPFSDALRHIAEMDLQERENEIEPELIIRLERLAPNGNLLVGEMIRRQIDNLPPQALEGQPVEALRVASIGHSAVFVYDPAPSVLALQIARNGITATRIGMYVENLGGHSEYDLLPVVRDDVWHQLQAGRIRGLTIGVASPETLEATDERTRNMRHGFQAIKQTLGGTARVDVHVAVNRGGADLNREEAVQTVEWLSNERTEGRGGVQNLQATIVPEGETRSELLNLIDAHMGGSEILDLPSDDPNQSYTMRVEFARRTMRRHQAEIARQNR